MFSGLWYLSSSNIYYEMINNELCSGFFLWYFWICFVFMVNTSICILKLGCRESSDGALSSLVLGPSAAERTSDLFVNWTKHQTNLYTRWTIPLHKNYAKLLSISGDLMQQINQSFITDSCGCISQDVLFVFIGIVIWWEHNLLCFVRIISKS